MKTYILMVAKHFPAYHPRAGQETYFKEKILLATNNMVEVSITSFFNPKTREQTSPELKTDKGKIHTIRSNYDLWARRAGQINAGKAVLSLRQWTGSPYNFKRDGSKQEEFLTLNRVYIQKIAMGWQWGLQYGKSTLFRSFDINGSRQAINQLAMNDGLSYDDFCHWFQWPYNPDHSFYFEGCIIHFTDFRYS